MKPELISYKYEVSPEQMVRFHLLSYTHMNAIDITRSDMNTLVLLVLRGPSSLMEFCNELLRVGIYLSLGSARNAIGVLCVEKKLIVKTGSHKKSISINPAVGVSIKNNTWLSVNCLLK